MKFGFEFQNLYGTVHTGANVIFTPDGNSVLSAVGNRVSVFNLAQTTSFTLPFENTKDIALLGLSPNGVILLSIDVDGRALLINLSRKALLGQFNFKSPVHALAFSPCGLFFGVSHDEQMHVWRTPGTSKEFAPFVLHRRYTGHHDTVTAIDWSHDSQFIATGSKDTTCRVYSLHPIEGYSPVTFTAHRDRIVSVSFVQNSYDIYTVSRDGSAMIWRHQDRELIEEIRSEKIAVLAAEVDQSGAMAAAAQGDDEETAAIEAVAEAEAVLARAIAKPVSTHRWSIKSADKFYFMQDHAKVICAVLHKASDVLVAGFSNGVFGLYEMPDFNNIHTLSVSSKRITTTAVNASGEWLAFGCARLGQLLVWEWQSETYVLKQQGHRNDLTCIAHAPDGRFLASGGADGKVKLWDTSSGFCVITFTEHVGEVSGLVFAQSGLVVLSASLDGTVRAFDLVRYRNFRTFTTPEPTQFSSVAVDPSGEMISAGCVDTFEICVWSMKTGRLLEMLSGHTGPVAAVAFSPMRTMLASASWDGTARLWDIFEHKGTRDVLELTTDVLAITFRPDGRECTTSSLNGQLTFFDITGPAQLVATIDGRKDIQGGRLAQQRISAKNSNLNKCYTSICYSADGNCLLAGGATKYVCIYELGQHVLLKRFCISSNRSLDGVIHMLNSKDLTDAGPASALAIDSDSDVEDRVDSDLPGVARGDHSSRRVAPEIRTTAVEFSPTGRSWAAASTAGLLVYSLDDTLSFDPFDLDVDVTPANVEAAIAAEEHIKAISMAFRLGEAALAEKAVEAVPHSSVALIAADVPRPHIGRLISLLARRLDKSPHLEYYLTWAVQVLNSHGRFIKASRAELTVPLRQLHKSLTAQQQAVGDLATENKYALRYLLECK